MVKKWTFILFFCIFLSSKISQVNAIDIDTNPDYIYYITGNVTVGEYDLYYGTAQHRIEKEYSALIIMKYHSDDSLYRVVIIDEGYNENTVFIGCFEDGSFGVVIEKFQYDYSIMGYVLSSTEIHKYDLHGNYVNRISYKEKFKAFNNHGYKIILSLDSSYHNDKVIDCELKETEIVEEYVTTDSFFYQFQGECIINGQRVDEINIDEVGYHLITISKYKYHQTLSVLILPKTNGFEKNGVYQGSVSIFINAKLYLDEEEIESDITISEAGYHTLKIEGAGGYTDVYDFTVNPIVQGVEDNGEYLSGVYIDISSGQTYLNSTDYLNNSLIAKPGRYILDILGANEYKYTISFTIFPSVINLENEGVYDPGYCLNFIGEGKLNGILVESGTSLIAGDYQFELLFEGEVYQQYSFKVIDSSNAFVHTPLKIPYLEIVLGIISLIGLFLVFRKK